MKKCQKNSGGFFSSHLSDLTTIDTIAPGDYIAQIISGACFRTRIEVVCTHVRPLLEYNSVIRSPSK